MARLMDRVGPCRLIVNPIDSPCEALVKSVVYQQLTGKAAATILGRLKDLFGGVLPPPAELLARPDEDLRAVGLSGAKTTAVKDVAHKTLDGVVPSLRRLRAMADDEVVAALTSIRGIGRWSVEMMLIFRLGRPDVWPVDDYGVRRGLAYLVGETEAVAPRRAAELGEAWRPYRSVAAWYLWRLAELVSSSGQRWQP